MSDAHHSDFPPAQRDATAILASVGLRVGDVVAQRYRVVDLLGHGGMGIVIGVAHVALGTPYAMKLLHYDLASSPTLTERFMREAQAATRLTSPHSVRVFDVAPLPSGGLYILMERLEGADLKTVLARGTPVPTTTAVGWIVQACRAIGEAHAMGVVHRDARPRNLFLVERGPEAGMIKVLDFGIAKLLHDEALGQLRPLTAAGTLLGAPRYMAPEQIASSRDVDARADVWSLGVSLYELLTGHLPFDGAKDSLVAHAVLTYAPPPPSVVRSDVPPAISDAVMQCLEKDPSCRFASARALESALVNALRIEEANAAAARALVATAASAPPPRAAPRRRTLAITTVGIGAAALAAVLAGEFARSQVARIGAGPHAAASVAASAAAAGGAPSASADVLLLGPMPATITSPAPSDVPPLAPGKPAPATAHDPSALCVAAALACERKLPDCQALLDDCQSRPHRTADGGARESPPPDAPAHAPPGSPRGHEEGP